MQTNIAAEGKPRTGRKPTVVGPILYKRYFTAMEPFLDEWQHAGSLAKRLEIPHARIAATLRQGVEKGVLETARTNPTSYRLAKVAANLPQPDGDIVDDDVEISLDSLRWLSIHLSVPSTMDDLCNGTRSRVEQVVDHLKAGIACGYVSVSGGETKTYTLVDVVPEDLSRGQVEFRSLRERMKKHLKGEMTSSQLVASMRLTRERVRQLLERAEMRGIVERLPTQPQRFRMATADLPSPSSNRHPVLDGDIKRLPITTRAMNVLAENGVETVSQLARYSRQELAALEGMGKKSVDEIVMVLAEMGLTPGESIH